MGIEMPSPRQPCCKLMSYFAICCYSAIGRRRAHGRGDQGRNAFYARRSQADRRTMHCRRTTRRGEEGEFSRSKDRQLPIHCHKRRQLALPSLISPQRWPVDLTNQGSKRLRQKESSFFLTCSRIRPIFLFLLFGEKFPTQTKFTVNEFLLEKTS